MSGHHHAIVWIDRHERILERVRDEHDFAGGYTIGVDLNPSRDRA